MYTIQRRRAGKRTQGGTSLRPVTSDNVRDGSRVFIEHRDILYKATVRKTKTVPQCNKKAATAKRGIHGEVEKEKGESSAGDKKQEKAKQQAAIDAALMAASKPYGKKFEVWEAEEVRNAPRFSASILDRSCQSVDRLSRKAERKSDV